MPKKASCSAVSISVLILVIEVWTIGENVLKRYTFLYDNAFNALMGACKNKPTIVWAKLFCFVFVETKKYTVKIHGSVESGSRGSSLRRIWWGGGGGSVALFP